MLPKRVSAVLLLCGGVTPALAGNLIGDGGFEMPAPPAGSYTSYYAGANIGRWLVTGPAGSNRVALVSTSFSQDGQVFDAKAGKSWIDLTGTTDTASGVSQAVPTVAGRTYKLIFWVGAVYDPTGIFAASSTVLVYNGSNLMMTATNTVTTSTGRQVWKRFAATFMATSASTTLGFVNGNPDDSSHQNCALDKVSLAAE